MAEAEAVNQTLAFRDEGNSKPVDTRPDEIPSQQMDAKIKMCDGERTTSPWAAFVTLPSLSRLSLRDIQSQQLSCTFLFILTLSIIVIYTTIRSHLNRLIVAIQNLYYKNTIFSSASKYNAATYLHHLTMHPHLVGTPAAIHTALYVKAQFEAHGLDT
ncbi:Uncharacterized protein Fot_56690 [Forsythia ovata]|uniref:Uncharacterized protein n=1 Tax=Forsythia ovata TaxID=205694 RepID=A0ABD1NYW8_9LAMI